MDASGSDTIAAIATAPGRGGIGVIRISGPRAGQILQAVCGMLPAPRRAALCDFRETCAGEEEHAVIDRGIALYFAAPHSFTGESGHGCGQRSAGDAGAATASRHAHLSRAVNSGSPFTCRH